MDTEVPAVYPSDPVESVLKVLRANELPGIPVVNEGGRCVGIITEADLVLSEEDADLHLPHYFQLFGGVVFLESMSHFEERLRKASASVDEAARIIARKRHNRLPVVEHGRLVGVVTRVDVLDALTNER